MSQNEKRGTGATAKSPSCPTPSTLQENMPHLDALFANLDRGVTPNFLDFMSGVSEMVAFHTDCDQSGADGQTPESERSQIKCRFCS